jgi:hypothetical protein
MRYAIAWVVGMAFCFSSYAGYPYLPPGWQTWMVFFPYKSTELGSSGQNTVRQVAALAVDFDTDVVIDANADAAEPDPENLSRARGEAIKAEFVKLGVPAAHIEIRAHGNGKLIVWTPSGTEEPQNRNAGLMIRNWRRKGTSTIDALNMPGWYADSCEPEPKPPSGAYCASWSHIYGKK